MGLNERRKIKELQEATFPGRVKEIEEICGAPIPYEVDWDTLADDPDGLRFIDNVSCHRVNMALRAICLDQMGRDAVCEGLKVVKLRNVKEESARKLVFAGGALEMDCAYANAIGGGFSDGEIREVLERGL